LFYLFLYHIEILFLGDAATDETAAKYKEMKKGFADWQNRF